MKKVPRIPVKCRKCSRVFQATENHIRRGRGKYCSVSCRATFAAYAMLSVRGESWKENVRKAMSKKIGMDETLHPRWKGDDAGYYAIHDWITKHFGQPIGCEQCGLNDLNKKYHWANISGNYHRSREDFRRLCVSCHRKFDYVSKRADKTLENSR